nr:MAG TPA: hypothetical protein [Caudoviricetes sp.]
MQKFTAQELLEYALKSGKSVSLKNGAIAKIVGYVSLTDEYIGYVVGISSVTLKQKAKATTWTKEGVNTDISDYNIKVISSTNELAEYALQNGIGMTIQTPYGKSTVNVIGKTNDSKYITVYQDNERMIAEYVCDEKFSLDKVDLVI